MGRRRRRGAHDRFDPSERVVCIFRRMGWRFARCVAGPRGHGQSDSAAARGVGGGDFRAAAISVGPTLPQGGARGSWPKRCGPWTSKSPRSGPPRFMYAGHLAKKAIGSVSGRGSRHVSCCLSPRSKLRTTPPCTRTYAKSNGWKHFDPSKIVCDRQSWQRRGARFLRTTACSARRTRWSTAFASIRAP